MFTIFGILMGKDPIKVLEEVEPHLAASFTYRKGDRFLGFSFTMIRLYGSQITPYKFPKFLSPKIFI